jgi:hypothetical protein
MGAINLGLSASTNSHGHLLRTTVSSASAGFDYECNLHAFELGKMRQQIVPGGGLVGSVRLLDKEGDLLKSVVVHTETENITVGVKIYHMGSVWTGAGQLHLTDLAGWACLE